MQAITELRKQSGRLFTYFPRFPNRLHCSHFCADRNLNAQHVIAPSSTSPKLENDASSNDFTKHQQMRCCSPELGRSMMETDPQRDQHTHRQTSKATTTTTTTSNKQQQQATTMAITYQNCECIQNNASYQVLMIRCADLNAQQRL